MRKRLPGLSARGGLLGALVAGALAVVLVAVGISVQLGPADQVLLNGSLGSIAFLSGAVIGLGGLVATLVVSRSMSRRLRALGRAAHAVSAGDLDRTVPALPGGDEVESLGRSFNAMTGSLRRARADELERSERLVALHRASTAVARQTVRSDALDVILREAARLLGAGGASLFLWDADAGVLRRARDHGSRDAALPTVVAPGEGVAGTAFARRAIFIVNDYAGWSGAAATAVASGQRAGLAAPLLRGMQRVGAITLRTYDWKQFTEDDARLLELFADQMVASLAMVDALDGQRAAAADADARRAESERLANEMRSLLESTSDGVLVVDERGSCTFINPAAQQMLGYSLAELGGDAHVLLHHPPGASAATALADCAFVAARSGGRPITGDDETLWRKDGSAFPARCVAAPVMRDGRATGPVIITFSDTSARKAAEQQFTASVELQRVAHERLVRLDKAKSEFVSILTHQLRTPLTGIQGFSELIRDEDLSIREMKEYADNINSEARRLARMIKETLDLDRMAAGRMTLDLGDVDLNQLIEALAAHAGPTMRGHPLLLQFDSDMPRIVGDEALVSEMLRNLLDNAVKYSPQGGDVIITTRREGQHAHVVVRDHGIGIADDSLEIVFDRFARVESEATRYVDGTGLGLPIVRQIVQLHGGRVWAESRLGHGSAFHLTLPLVAVPAIASP
ncbi:MAG: ATP-binding protein [Candidatus Limnocylindria bacterium]